MLFWNKRKAGVFLNKKILNYLLTFGMTFSKINVWRKVG